MTASYDRIVGDYGQTIAIVMTGADFTSSTAVIKAQPPAAGTIKTWTATIDAGNEEVVYVLVTGDLDIQGTWLLQAVITKSGNTKVTKSAPVELVVGPSIS